MAFFYPLLKVPPLHTFFFIKKATPSKFNFFLVCNIGEPPNTVIVRCSPNKLHEFYSLISFRRREKIDNSIFGGFFKCQTTSMSGFFMEHLLDSYEGEKVSV